MEDVLSPKEEELLSIIKSHITGISQEELEKELSCPIEERVELLNSLISQRRVEVIDKNGEVKLRFQSAEDAGKYKELTALEAAVFEYIKESGCKGICTKELTTKTGMGTKSINPVLKSMQNKGSIKSVQSIQGKRKKVWMLSHLEPSADITGGIFYKNQEIDVDLINTLNFRILEYIKSHGPSPRSEISNYLRTSGLLSRELKEDDACKLLNALVYDGKIIQVENNSSNAGITLRETGKILPNHIYRLATLHPSKYDFEAIPCINCPLFKDCSTKGLINPIKCEILDRWLNLDNDTN